MVLVSGFSLMIPNGNVTSTQVIMSIGCGTLLLVGGFGSGMVVAAIDALRKQRCAERPFGLSHAGDRGALMRDVPIAAASFKGRSFMTDIYPNGDLS